MTENSQTDCTVLACIPVTEKSSINNAARFNTSKTSSSAIADRPRCRLGRQPLWRNRLTKLSNSVK